MNKLKGLSLFANVGVAETYLSDVNIDILLANEIQENRAKFYQHLYPDVEMITGDITNPKIMDLILKRSRELKIDFLIATPPCQGMSLAGKMDKKDERNQLIYYAIKVIKEIRPKYILLENVPQQLKTVIRVRDKEMLIPEYLINELSSDYYFAKESLISAMDYDVPQMRKRNIILLSRKDMSYKWELPRYKKEKITLLDAIGDLPSLDPILKEGMDETLSLFPDFYDKLEEARKISKWHSPPKHAKKHVISLIHTPSGKTAFDNEIYFPKKNDGTRVNGHYNTYRRFDWNKPSRTITQNNGVISSLCCVHPGRKIFDDGNEETRYYSDPRCLTIYELLIVSSLPTNWNIPDWANESLIRKVIGEGIPPMLIKHIAGELDRNREK